MALNKNDLKDQWVLNDDDYKRLEDMQWQSFKTSAKTGRRVEHAFYWLALETLRA